MGAIELYQAFIFKISHLPTDRVKPQAEEAPDLISACR